MNRMYTAEDTLTRAEKEREREINEQAVDDMIRLEGEFDDVINCAQALLQDGWYDMESVLAKTREALEIVKKRRRIVERYI
jgi:hypothetical protein